MVTGAYSSSLSIFTTIPQLTYLIGPYAITSLPSRGLATPGCFIDARTKAAPRGDCFENALPHEACRSARGKRGPLFRAQPRLLSFRRPTEPM